MTDYTDLVRHLRNHGPAFTKAPCCAMAMDDAADAIEQLLVKVDEAWKLVGELTKVLAHANDLMTGNTP